MIHNIANRGASAYEPENTLRAFDRAIEMGATMLELDVHLSQDGVCTNTPDVLSAILKELEGNQHSVACG